MGVTSAVTGDGWCVMIFVATKVTANTRLFVGISDKSFKKLDLVPCEAVHSHCAPGGDTPIQMTSVECAAAVELMCSTVKLNSAGAYATASSRAEAAAKQGLEAAPNNQRSTRAGKQGNKRHVTSGTPLDARTLRPRGSTSTTSDEAEICDVDNVEEEEQQMADLTNMSAADLTNLSAASLRKNLREKGERLARGEKKSSLVARLQTLLRVPSRLSADTGMPAEAATRATTMRSGVTPAAAPVAPEVAPATSAPETMVGVAALQAMQKSHEAQVKRMQLLFDSQQHTMLAKMQEQQRAVQIALQQQQASDWVQQKQQMQTQVQAQVTGQLDQLKQQQEAQWREELQAQQQQMQQQQERMQELRCLLQQNAEQQQQPHQAPLPSTFCHPKENHPPYNPVPPSFSHPHMPPQHINQDSYAMPAPPFQYSPQPPQQHLGMPPHALLPLSPRQHQHQHSYANSTMPPQHTHAHLLQMYSQAQAEAQESSRDARVRANALAMRLGFM